MKTKIKQNRPISARVVPTINKQVIFDLPSAQLKVNKSSRFLEKFDSIRSHRKTSGEIDEPITLNAPLTINIKFAEDSKGSRSKLLQKYDRIKDNRDSSGRSIQENNIFEAPKSKQKQLSSKIKVDNLTSNSAAKLLEIPSQTKLQTKQKRKLSFNALRQKHRAPVTVLFERVFVQLRKIEASDLIFPKQSKDAKEIVAFWPAQKQYVSLIPLQKNQKLDFSHNNILAIHAQVNVKGIRCVVADQYRNCSLKNLLDEFGALPEQLCRRYLRQIALGMQHMHYNKRGHNRLNTKAILYNLNGELCINPVKATSFALTKEQLSRHQLAYFSPQFLLTKDYAQGLKNDIWALGCIALEMLTKQLTGSPHHPYSRKQFSDASEDMLMDNLRQLNINCFVQRGGGQGEEKRKVLSQVALDFIGQCLQIVPQRRPKITSLLEHQFFQGI